MNKNSPYSATITGCALLFNEFMRVLPLLMSQNSAELIKNELQSNELLQVNSQKARQTFMNEFKRRFNAVPYAFWVDFQKLTEDGKKAALLYTVLKAYKLAFDFHFSVTIKRWNSVERTLLKNDLMMEFNEIGARDAFVDGWTDNTKKQCVSKYLTILRQVGMLDGETNELKALHLEANDFAYYIHSGEEWFLEACLLYPYEVSDIKAKLL